MSEYQYDMRQFEEQGQVPRAFTPQLMPEWDYENGMKLSKGIGEIESYTRQIHDFMKSERAKFEARWSLCREYYDMDSKYKQDKERLASIFHRAEHTDDDELDPDRAAIIHPLVFEAVQQQQARIVKQMFGGGPRYVEVLGRNSNDIPAAKIYEEIANYQQDWQIPTDDIADDFVNSGLVEGTGIITRQWDFARNCPDDECTDIFDYWFDPEGAYHHKDRWNVWRRYPTLGKLLTMREQGWLYFTDADMESALNKKIDTRQQTYSRRQPRISLPGKVSGTPLVQQASRHHEIVALDIFMQQEGTERWVYRANDLVVGIRPNPVPKDEGVFRYPCAIFSPIRKKRSKYGDSAVYRMLDSQDLVNSLSYMMMSNFARTALGLMFGDPSAYQGDDAPKPGYVNPMADPKQNIHTVTFPDMTTSAMNAIGWLKHEVTDSISGVSEPARGQQVSANQTASSVNQLIEQSNYRMESMSRRGRKARRDYDAIGLLLNQAYLRPTTAFRITDEKGAWRPVGGNDLFGVAGKDLMPTGYPVNGSNTFFTQQALNEVAMIMQTGGDPVPFMRKYLQLKYNGSFDENTIYPETGQPGQDPVQENEYMAQGMPVKLSPNDDDMRHILEHNNLFLYLVQSNMDPQIIQNVFTHMQQHQSRYQQVAADNGQSGAGGGTGIAGLNMAIPGPDPKQDGEIQAQMEARNAG